MRDQRLIGIVDTTFARVDMGGVVAETLGAHPDYGERLRLERRTVPGFKDLAVAAKILIEDCGAAIVVACGWVGGEDVDLQSAHEASLGLMAAQLLTNTHILGVFVHEREKDSIAELNRLCVERCRKHASNAIDLLFAPETLIRHAGQGLRQGDPDVGPLSVAG